MEVNYGIISLIPVLLVFVIAFRTKKTLESLLIGSVVGFIILEGTNFIAAWLEALINVLKDDTVLWVILVTFFFGAMINLFEKSGAMHGFVNFAVKYTKSKKSALVTTWLLSLLIFIDDYLHNLVIGSSMKRITDRYQISRAKLAYINNSTAGNLASLVPLSTWGVFYAGLMGQQGLAIGGSDMQAYLRTIPFQFYPIVAMILSLLVAMVILPDLGEMKKCEELAAQGILSDVHLAEEESQTDTAPAYYFFVPIAVLIIVTLLTGIDVLMGILFALIAIFLLYVPTKRIKAEEFMEITLEGFGNMMPIAAILAIAFTLMEANTRLGLAPYIIDLVLPFMSGRILPVIVFLTCVVFAYFTGMFWDMAAVMFPIAIPLATSIGADPYLVAATIFSASAWGSQICMYGDAVVINSGACDVSPASNSISSLPYGILGVAISALLYLVAGFIL